MKPDKNIVICLKCKHTFITKVLTPRCSKCGSTLIRSAKDAPKVYAGKEIEKLRIEFDGYKESRDKMILELLKRIEVLEAKI